MDNDDISGLIAEDAMRPVSADKLDEIRALARTAQSLEQAVADAEEHLTNLKRMRNHLVEGELPELMDSVGLKSITVEAKGNLPEFTCAVKTIYRCNIGANWEAERRRAAFEWLENHGHGSLIKTEVNVPFSREDRERVSAFVKLLEQSNVHYNVKENVHPSTMTSWLREMVERRNETPPLDTLGGYIGREAVIKTERDNG